jgi:hypothetical protein
MPMSNNDHAKTGTSYEIRIRNHLETCWSSFFEGWSIDNLADGEVLLRNSNVDKAGLHGILNRILDLNLTLLSVRVVDELENLK